MRVGETRRVRAHRCLTDALTRSDDAECWRIHAVTIGRLDHEIGCPVLQAAGCSNADELKPAFEHEHRLVSEIHHARDAFACGRKGGTKRARWPGIVN
jgi:hypothetical protein